MKRFLALLALMAFLVPAAGQEMSEEAFDDDSGARLTAVEAQRVLDRPPPAAGAPKQAQVDYWVQRQRAAFAAGRGELRREALRKLVDLTEEPGKPNAYVGFLWREEVRFGNQTRALEIGEALVADRRFLAPVRISHMADLGLDYLGFGNASGARSMLRRADEELAKVKGDDASPTTMNYMRSAIERLRARLAQHEGDVEGAERAVRRGLEVARQEYERAKAAAAGGKDPRANFLYDRAIRTRNGTMSTAIHVYYSQGRNVEAEAIAREGLKLAEDERTGGANIGFWNERIALAALGDRRYADAEAAARKGVAELLGGGSVGSAERVQMGQLTLLQSLLGQKRWADADALYQQMRSATSDDAAARTRIDNATLQAFLHLRNNRLDEAKERIEASVTYRARHFGENHANTVESKAVRAMVHQGRGDTRLALQDYEALFRSIFAPETSFRDAQPRGMRGFWVPLALESYLALVAAEYQRNGGKVDAEMADRAFRVADRLQLSAVQQALVDGAARILAGTPELAALARQEQEQRVKMSELLRDINRRLEEEGRLRKAATDAQAAKKDEAAAAAERERQKKSGQEIARVRQSIAALDKERAETQVEVARRFPSYAALVNPKPPALAEVAKSLGRDEAFVSVLPAEMATFVWGVAPGGAIAFHVAPVGRSEIGARVEKLRTTLDQGERAANPARFDAEASFQLYTLLVAPVWPKLGNPKLVTFAGASELGRIPFATLVTQPPAGSAGPQYLLRTAAVNQVASAAAFRALRESRPRGRAREAFFGFGDPAFANAQLPPLPETRDEIVAIAKALGADPARDARFGRDATRKAALEAPLAERRVVAFATHGLKAGDLPGLSRPALALSPAGADDPALLVLDDVLTLKLGAEWVVLSACNTASSDGRAQEAFSGLARGFFFAGARSVLATHWAVETVSAQELVTRAFAYQAANPGASRAESLRQAQLDLLDGKAGPGYGHPFFWAPYALYGDPSL